MITPFWDDRRVAIIDSGVFGGTCLNRGCIPTKMFAYPSQLAASAAKASRLGVDLEAHGARWREIRDRIFTRIDAISDGGRRYRDEELDNTTLVDEEVRFTGPKQLTTAGGAVIEADNIVVAAGSRPVLPVVPGIDLPQVHTSDTVMRVDELPEKIIVVGGGFIAAEFASIFSGLGSEVVQVNRSPRLLRSHDDTISERFTELAARQWDLRTGAVLSSIEPLTDGGSGTGQRVRVNFTAAYGDQASATSDFSEDANLVLIAQGRTPNTDRLNVAAASEGGLDVREDGTLATDSFGRLLSAGQPVPGLWGIGDVVNSWQLKHVANHEQRVVAHNLEHPDDLRSMELTPVPSAVFSRPQIATAGLTEAEALALYGADRISVKVQDYGAVAYGWAMEDDHGLVKLIAERDTGLIVGAHLLGEDASNLIQPLIQAMSFGLDAHTMARGQYWIHPALAEVVENALLGLEVPVSGHL
ncbi:mycothione reductase [Citricoccus sp. NR2]|nr:mycothione reductase [Citricoccus sp. NR2]WBL18092.1 mycothione reductase [Citricoccus sp. NR2]